MESIASPYIYAPELTIEVEQSDLTSLQQLFLAIERGVTSLESLAESRTGYLTSVGKLKKGEARYQKML
jgi:hypothetical protein